MKPGTFSHRAEFTQGHFAEPDTPSSSGEDLPMTAPWTQALLLE
jgi:hypothetical protein